MRMPICYPNCRFKFTQVKLLALLAALVLGTGAVRAQDAQFSQYYAAPLFINPAMAGVSNNVVLGLNYRRQNISLEFPYEIGQFSVMVPINQSGSEQEQIGGWGASVFTERAGPDGQLTTTGVYATGALNFGLNFDKSSILVAGLQVGYIQKSIDFANLRWGSQYNRFIGFDNTLTPGTAQFTEQTAYPVFNAGLLYYFNPKRSYVLFRGSAFSGVSVSNINSPNESLVDDDQVESPLPMLLKYHGGVEFYLTQKMRWAPQILALFQSNKFQFNAGTYLSYNLNNPRARNTSTLEVILGTWYRFQDSFIFSGGINTTRFTLGFSYDLNISTLRYESRGTGGTFELSLSMQIPTGKGLRTFKTPLM